MGRPRHFKVREPNGRARRLARGARIYQDYGTDEALARRATMVGGFPDPSEPKRNCSPADKRAGYPMGILFLRGDITEAEYEAGLRYVRLHFKLFGSGSTHSHLANIQVGNLDIEAPGEELQLTDAEKDELVARAETELTDSTAALQALPTRRPYSILCNLALYDRPMRFMDTSQRRTPGASLADDRDLEALKLALDTLAAMPHRRRPHAARP
jgi:hypothetical protein